MTGPQLYQIWSPDDFAQAARDFNNHTDQAIALTKPEREPAVVVDLFSRREIR